MSRSSADVNPPIVVADAFPPVEVSAGPDPGAWIARARLASGDRVALHSARNPRAEANLQLAPLEGTTPAVIVLIGAGLGFLTEAAHARWPEARIVALEPSRTLADQARARTPDLYASGRVTVIPGADYDSPRPLWQWFDIDSGTEPAILVHPVIARLAPHATAQAEAAARRAILGAQMNAKAREDNAGRYLLHTLRNLPVVARSSDPARLSDRFSGLPVVIVAAGPSLDRQLPVLRRVRDRALVIAADTAWRPLVAAGIDPHVVVAVDPTEMNGRHLLQVPGRQPWLLAEPSIDPRAATTFDGHFGAFRVGTHHPWPWLAALGIQRPVVRVWGSVVTAALDLALIAGADPIIFVATDLAFTDRRPYARGTTFEEDWARFAANGVTLRTLWDHQLASRPLVTVADVHGADTESGPHLVEFRDWLVARSLERPDRRFINTTGAGILTGGRIEQSDLASLLDRAPRIDDEITARLATLATSPEAAATDRLRPALDTLAREAATTPRERLSGTLAEWLHFGRPSLSLDELRLALRAAADAMRRGGGSASPARQDAQTNHHAALPPLRLPHGDRAARMRARLTGDRTFLLGTMPSAPEPAAPEPAAAARVEQAIDQLLAIECPLLTAAEIDTLFAGDPARPLSYRFPWSPEAAPLVAALEEALLDLEDLTVIETAFPPRAPDSFWNRPIAPTLDADEELITSAADLTPPSADTLLRLALTFSAHELREPHESSTADGRLPGAILRGLADPRLRPGANAGSRLRLRDSQQPLRMDALRRALTGTLAPLSGFQWPSSARQTPFLIDASIDEAAAGPPADPRLRFLRPDVRFIAADVLTERGAPRGWTCSTIDAQSASLSPTGAVQSVRVDADGTIHPHITWPFEVTGEIAFGSEGGSLAWTRSKSLIWLRAARGADAIVAMVPFRPFCVAVTADGGALWLGDQGGLWEWLPGRGGRLLIDTPLAAGLEINGDDVLVYPLARDAEQRIAPRRLTHAWKFDRRAQRLDEITAGAEGPCLTCTTHEGWTARAFSFADTIRLTHDDGRAAALACHAPFCTAWAGDSLVVTTLDGDVLLFRDLRSRLHA